MQCMMCGTDTFNSDPGADHYSAHLGRRVILCLKGVNGFATYRNLRHLWPHSRILGLDLSEY